MQPCAAPLRANVRNYLIDDSDARAFSKILKIFLAAASSRSLPAPAASRAVYPTCDRLQAVFHQNFTESRKGLQNQEM
jgi:hypothetical protein